MDIREYTSPTLPVAQFVERYVDTDHYDAGCRGCDNYGQVWVCPPYDFSVSGYWSGFREVCLRGVQLRFSPEEQARSYDPEDLAERLRQLFSRTARQMILRQSNMTERSLITRCNLINSVRSDNNPHGFTMEKFEIVENRDIRVTER